MRLTPDQNHWRYRNWGSWSVPILLHIFALLAIRQIAEDIGAKKLKLVPVSVSAILNWVSGLSTGELAMLMTLIVVIITDVGILHFGLMFRRLRSEPIATDLPHEVLRTMPLFGATGSTLIRTALWTILGLAFIGIGGVLITSLGAATSSGIRLLEAATISLSILIAAAILSAVLLQLARLELIDGIQDHVAEVNARLGPVLERFSQIIGDQKPKDGSR